MLDLSQDQEYDLDHCYEQSLVLPSSHILVRNCSSNFISILGDKKLRNVKIESLCTKNRYDSKIEISL